ncbi:MAG: hypothetical protein H6598_07850 [Flavobacteriales bacterium]|nr:hypothetical protein [Flavobacteriales bacterium]
MFKRIIIGLVVILLSHLISGCASDEKIMVRIQEKKLKVSEKLRSFKTSLTEGDNLTTFYKHEKSFFLPGTLEEVWNLYCHVGPRNMWSGPKNKFKMAYSKSNDIGFYKREDSIPGPSEGMVYELKLKILKLIKVPVSFEITKLSEDSKIIEFTYGLENKSHGKQILKFEASEGGTNITHTSYFKSGNTVRDKKLYPFFHEKCIDEFYENMMERLNNFVSNS